MTLKDTIWKKPLFRLFISAIYFAILLDRYLPYLNIGGNGLGLTQLRIHRMLDVYFQQSEKPLSAFLT